MPLILLSEDTRTLTQESLDLEYSMPSSVPPSMPGHPPNEHLASTLTSSPAACPKSYRPQLTREALLIHAFGHSAVEKWQTRTLGGSPCGTISECGSSRSTSLSRDKRWDSNSFTPPPLGTFSSVSPTRRRNGSISHPSNHNPNILSPLPEHKHRPTWDPMFGPGAQMDSERERPMTAAEWKEKTEERRRLKLMRQMEKRANTRAGTMHVQLPLDITCKLDEGLMNFAPAFYESLRDSTYIPLSRSERIRIWETGVSASPNGLGKNREMMMHVEEKEGSGHEVDVNSHNQEEQGHPPIEDGTTIKEGVGDDLNVTERRG